MGGDFPGSPVFHTLCYPCRGHGFDPLLGKIPHTTAKNRPPNNQKDIGEGAVSSPHDPGSTELSPGDMAHNPLPTTTSCLT